jgi:hypothetical protein
MLMWRVALSVVAVAFDALLMLFTALAIVGLLSGSGSHPITAPHAISADAERTVRAVNVVVGFVISAGLTLNMLAIGFGARLRLSRRTSRTEIAAEFN